jgi:sulfate adenylyltransferase subunit 1 (EFTu-like GTPase family)
VDRGWVGFDAEYAPVVTDHLTPKVFWIGPRPLETNGRIELLCGTQSRTGTVETIARVIDPVCLETIETAATTLDVSQVGQIAIHTDAPMCIDPFDVTPELGRFAIIQNGRIAGGGVIAE